MHGVRAEIVETVLHGIDKREGSYDTFVHVLGVRGDERIEAEPFMARRMRSRSPEFDVGRGHGGSGVFEKSDNTHARFDAELKPW